MEKNTNTANTVASKAKKNKKPGFFAKTWGKIKEIFSELKKVSWPNFKTVVKTITSIDKTEHLDKFAESLQSIELSSNTVLSALQMLDKKTEQVENALVGLATKEDLTEAKRKVVELAAQSQELTFAVTNVNDKFSKFDSLSEKLQEIIVQK